jgi:CBS domain-containing protein
MNVKHIMTPHVKCASPNDTLQAAARMMRDLDVGGLPVCNNDRLVGMVTDRDITIRGIAEGKDPNETKVEEVMTTEVIYCYDDQDVRDAALIMQENQVRRVLVLNRDKRLVGIVSLGDIATEGRDPQNTSQVLEDVSLPAAPQRR